MKRVPAVLHVINFTKRKVLKVFFREDQQPRSGLLLILKEADVDWSEAKIFCRGHQIGEEHKQTIGITDNGIYENISSRYE